MLKDTPLVSIISVNWNNTAVTCDLLRSIRELNTYHNIEVILVDNGSSDDPTKAFQAELPGVNIIRTGKNLGFSGGNNAGIRVATGKYLFLVNNDTEFTPGLIEGLLDIYEKYPDAGMVCPKFHYYFSKGTIEYAGYEPVNMFTGRNGMIGCREKDEGQYDEISTTHYAHGGAMMVPRQIINEVGLLYEPFSYTMKNWTGRSRSSARGIRSIINLIL